MDKLIWAIRVDESDLSAGRLSSQNQQRKNQLIQEIKGLEVALADAEKELGKRKKN